MTSIENSLNAADFVKRRLPVSALSWKSADLMESLTRAGIGVHSNCSARPICVRYGRHQGISLDTDAINCAADTDTRPSDCNSRATNSDTRAHADRTLTRSDSERGFDATESPVSAGRVAIEVVNETDSPVEFHMWMLQGTYTYQEFEQYIEEEKRLAEAGAEGLGPPSGVGNFKQLNVLAGASETVVRNLSPGTYAIECFQDFAQAGIRPFALVGPIEVEG